MSSMGRSFKLELDSGCGVRSWRAGVSFECARVVNAPKASNSYVVQATQRVVSVDDTVNWCGRQQSRIVGLGSVESRRQYCRVSNAKFVDHNQVNDLSSRTLLACHLGM
jgi:hypothetical protein